MGMSKSVEAHFTKLELAHLIDALDIVNQCNKLATSSERIEEEELRLSPEVVKQLRFKIMRLLG